MLNVAIANLNMFLCGGGKTPVDIACHVGGQQEIIMCVSVLIGTMNMHLAK